uniref:Uncharacterized protein n=1 Tax=Anguilla anguilla TaxID=7936 RepID=A0A0E9WBT1_ANGAN
MKIPKKSNFVPNCCAKKSHFYTEQIIVSGYVCRITVYMFTFFCDDKHKPQTILQIETRLLF